MEIYAPIANRLGLNAIYHELEDLSFKHLYPKRYEVLSKALKVARGNRREVVGKSGKPFANARMSITSLPKYKGEKNIYMVST